MKGKWELSVLFLQRFVSLKLFQKDLKKPNRNDYLMKVF